MSVDGDNQDHEYKEQLRFMTLLAELSARFVKLSAEEVDKEIENAQRLVCEFLDLDISALWQWEAETPDIYVLTHLYRPIPSGPPTPERMVGSEVFPWSQQQIMAGNTFAISSMEKIPQGSEKDLEGWLAFELKTNLTISLRVGDRQPFGAISFNDIRKERVWTKALIQQLELIAQVFANALLRTRSESAQRKSEIRLAMAAESANAGIWSLNLGTHFFWTTPKGRELFGLEPDDVISWDSFMEMVHPEDRESIKQTLETILESEEEGVFEYRTVLADGLIRWMTSRGRVQRDLPGEEHTVLTGVTVDITERKQAELQLKVALAETQELRDRLSVENTYLREQVSHVSGHKHIIGNAAPVLEMLEQARLVAPTDSTVLITGETGTGKELLANTIHEQSTRKSRALVNVNCAALPPALIESELFGREKGAYTGALSQQVGRFEVADGGTLFLDEIGELPLEIQTKLLRVLQDGSFERLGSYKTLHSDVRIIAATNRDLLQMVQQRSFREDLYHRLNIFPIESPPLRDRQEDIPELTWRFVQYFNQHMGRAVDSIPKKALEALTQYSWPGNIRELRNLVERAMIISTNKKLCIQLPRDTNQNGGFQTLEDVERSHIQDVLEKCQWRIGGPEGAAQVLDMARTTLNARIKKLGLSRS